MNKNFPSKNGISIEKCKKIQFLRWLIKISISKLSFSTGSAKKPTIYDLSFLIAIYYPKSDDKYSFETRNYHYSSHFTITEVFSGLGPILMTGLKY